MAKCFVMLTIIHNYAQERSQVKISLCNTFQPQGISKCFTWRKHNAVINYGTNNKHYILPNAFIKNNRHQKKTCFVFLISSTNRFGFDAYCLLTPNKLHNVWFNYMWLKYTLQSSAHVQINFVQEPILFFDCLFSFLLLILLHGTHVY